jgi:2-succinyl-6-hydroxy-2,4-cyclohexadiene-1-carboxylate synthase
MTCDNAVSVVLTIFNGFLGLGRDWDFLRDIQPAERVLMGYSMGGRLALQALLDGAPFDRAVIVSAGLNLETGREERRARDEAWARRFESDVWGDVIGDWNAQPVFGAHVLRREERDYDRAELARQLRENSPGLLPPLAARLHEIAIPVLWIAGQRDAPYVEIARRAVALLPKAELWICPDAGHRVPWEQPRAFAARLRQFVSAR